MTYIPGAGDKELPVEPTDYEGYAEYVAENPTGDEHHISLDNWVDYVAKHSTERTWDEEEDQTYTTTEPIR